MNSKKKIYIFVIISFVLVAVLPTLNYINNPKELTQEKMFNTDIFESYRNYLAYKLFSKSYDNHSVVVGKKDFLYLGNKNNYLVSKTQNIYPKHPKSINNWVDNLYSLQKYYESQGIKFILAVVPNKHSVYSEFLPNWIEYNENVITDELISKSQKLGINIINLKEALMEYKSDEELIYSITDSHWNSKGAAIGFDKTIDVLNEKYQLDFKSPNYELKKKGFGGMGLSRLLKMKDLIAEDFETVYFPRLDNLGDKCQGDININSLELQDCKQGAKGFFDIHKGPKYIINPFAVNSQKLLLLCDSFSMQNAKLFDASFKTIWKFHYNKITDYKLKLFIKQNQPDVVIYQVVERSLYNNKFISIF